MQLADARLQAAKIETDLISTQLGQSVAERDAAMARRELESMRKQMALAAAEMSTELARMRKDMTDEHNRAVIEDLALLKKGLEAMDKVQWACVGGGRTV